MSAKVSKVSPDIFHPVPQEGAIERDWTQATIICEILHSDWSREGERIVAHFEYAPGDTSKVKGRKGTATMLFCLPIVKPYTVPSAD